MKKVVLADARPSTSEPKAKNGQSTYVTTGGGEMVLRIKCKFIRPMLMHSPKLIDPTEALAIKIRELQKKRKELGRKQDTSSIEAEILRTQFLGSVYWNEKAKKFYIPNENLEAVIKAGAMKSKLGKQAEAGIRVESDGNLIYLEDFSHGTDIEKIYESEIENGGNLVFKRAVRIPPRTGARVMCHRMMIPSNTTFEADVIFDSNIISEVDTKKACVNGGLYAGLGVWRPKYGRFIVQFLYVKKNNPLEEADEK